tara:strand:+ start:406 stop:510 length:105 start_codon:yes stop_codon:yes gene_type:complete
MQNQNRGKKNGLRLLQKCLVKDDLLVGMSVTAVI